jgi:hypothetical protein
MNNNQTTRRRFLVAAIAFSGAASGTFGPSMLRISSAWAESKGKPDDVTMRAMVRMARLLYPHDAMSDAIYGEILDNTLAATASDGSFAEALNAAEQALDAARSADWVDLDESQQIAVMHELEGEGFFAAIQGAVRGGLYFHPEFWKHIGYPGSSKELGGYINRGSDDIDWLPENS